MQGVFRKSLLPNGVRVVTEKIPNVRSISVGIWVCAGSRDETGQEAGISHLIEHMIFKGTERHSSLDIAKIFDQMGGMSNAFTSKEATCFHAKVLDVHMDKVLNILSDIFLYSTFDPLELDRERQVVLQEISMVEDSPDELIHDLFCGVYWPGHGLGRPVLGTRQTVSAFDSGRIRRYIDRAYVGPNVLVAAAGNVEHESFFERVSSKFYALANKDSGVARRSPIPHAGASFIQRDIEQAHIMIGFEGPPLSDTQGYYSALLLNTVLGGSMSSRLFQEIREKRGLAYAVYSFLSSYHDSGLIGLYAAVSPKDTSVVAGLMKSELARLADDPLSIDELCAAKDHLRGELLLSSESTDTRMTRLAKNEILYGGYVSYDETVGRIDAVTSGDIKRLAANCLNGKSSIVCLGRIADSEAAICERLISV